MKHLPVVTQVEVKEESLDLEMTKAPSSDLSPLLADVAEATDQQQQEVLKDMNSLAKLGPPGSFYWSFMPPDAKERLTAYYLSLSGLEQQKTGVEMCAKCGRIGDLVCYPNITD